MDEHVIAAMARWPNVPDVYGWLSLTEAGLWRLHPRGDACDTATGSDAGAASDNNDGGAGESITSPQIIRFINRNYARDDKGQWFFQNGPQKVYVRLDAAPFILRTGNPVGDAASLSTHTALEVHTVQEWWLDDAGRLYACTEHGPGLIAGRDLTTVLEGLYTTEGSSLMSALETEPKKQDAIAIRPLHAGTGTLTSAVTLGRCAAADIPGKLGFIRNPRPA